jgi:ribonuclease J
MAAGSSRTDPVRVLALGGLGEIGLNLTVVEYGGSAILIDAGVMFPPRAAFGAGLIVPDLGYLEQRRLKLLGLVLTHAHEDHVGALPQILDRFALPVYGTRLTLAFARRRLRAQPLAEGAALRTIAPGERIDLGPFRVEPVRVTHSTPDSIALAIGTPAGIIVHSGDFKIDETPIDGQRFDTRRFAELGNQGVELLLSDSTNVERPGRSGSESAVRPRLAEQIARCRGKFFLSAFSSHLHRIRQLVELSREAGRMVVPIGRRMIESVRLGCELGELNFPSGTFIDPAEAEFLAPRHLTFIAGGSQAEPMSALTRLAANSFPRVRIDPGDSVVLSSRFIPGNERPIITLINDLYKLGAEVVYETVAPVHVSGHASREELADMIRLVKPRHFVPIHGEYRHLKRHLELAIEAGIPAANCYLLENGDSLILESGRARRGARVHAGRVILEGEGPADAAVVEERRLLSRGGTVIAVVAISAASGELIAGPELISRGFITGDGTSPQLRAAQAELAARLRAIGPALSAVDQALRDDIVRTLETSLQAATGRRPLVVPHVMEVEAPSRAK